MIIPLPHIAFFLPPHPTTPAPPFFVKYIKDMPILLPAHLLKVSQGWLLDLKEAATIAQRSGSYPFDAAVTFEHD
jgi:hypothetical protein